VSQQQRVLFVCGRNRSRSPTAERVFAREPGLLVRAAGVHASAVRVISSADIAWADVIFVMERSQRFGSKLRGTALHVLDIPDEYALMDAELVELLKLSVTPLLALD
jgi:predicted protein tyrosine phosphatase